MAKQASMAMARPMSVSKSNVKLPKFVWGVFSLISLMLVAFLAYQLIYTSKIFPNVKVAGISVGGKNESEAQSLINQKIDEINQKPLDIVYESQPQSAKLADLGIEIQKENQTKDAVAYGRNQSFLKSQKEIFKAIFHKQNLPLAITISDQKLNQFLTPISQKIKAPQNASLKIDGSTISVVASQNGFAIDVDGIKEQIKNEVGLGIFGPIVVKAEAASPIINENGVTEAKSQAEKVMASPLTLTYQDKVFTTSGAQIGLFIKFEEKDNKLVMAYNDETISKYVASIAGKVDIKAVDTEILSTTGQVTKEGSDGQSLNQQNTKNQIKEALSGTDKTISLKVDPKIHGQKTVFPQNVAVGGRYPGKYIDIDLSEQKLYAFDGMTLVNSFLISSGVASHPSPIGTFAIYSRSRSVLMAGPGYYLPNVEWVNRFTGPYSIHGTYWHNNFGHPMSHGCINASNGNAQFIFDWAPIGTPVIIHK